MPMMNENETRMNEIISKINAIKQEAIIKGFDYPTEDITTASETELTRFYQELVNYVNQV